MIFWAGILIAVLFALSAIKLGFYHAWTMLVNLVIAVYMAVRIGSSLEDFFPAAVSGQYSRTLALLATGTGVFLVLQGIAYVLLIGQFEVTFPRAVNLIGSALLGFLAGFLVWSFGTFVFCTTPLCENQFVKEVGLDTKTFEEAKMQSYLVWWCNFMDKFVGTNDEPIAVDKVVKDLLTQPVKRSASVADVNSRGLVMRPGNVSEPNCSTRPSSTEPNSVIPP